MTANERQSSVADSFLLPWNLIRVHSPCPHRLRRACIAVAKHCGHGEALRAWRSFVVESPSICVIHTFVNFVSLCSKSLSDFSFRPDDHFFPALSLSSVGSTSKP
jgi:hypothetical protein